MRKISANYIFPVSGKPLHNGIIVVGDMGEILDLIDTNGKLADAEKLEFYNGIIVPGFVNTHCHLELSHLKGKIDMYTGLPGFIEQLVKTRNANPDEIHSNIELADFNMKHEGIVAVGDISNNSDSFFQKQISSIKYHTFIEIYGSENTTAESRFNSGQKLLDDAINFYSLQASIAPHAPYSMSNELLKLIANFTTNSNATISIHNQETLSENEMFITKSGALFDMLCKLGSDYSEWTPTRKNSLESVIKYFPQHIKTLLVHNTYSTLKDFADATNHFSEVYWCLCPNANLFIEQTLPDIFSMYKTKLKMTIGTDSLASNTKLSVLSELFTIQKHFPQIPLSEIIQWATLNGANALGFSNTLGSFDLTKIPGINLIENVDLQNMKLTDKSSVKVLV